MDDNTKEFLQAYGELVKKFKIDFMAYPEFVPNEKGLFSVQIRTIPVPTDKKTIKDFIA